MAGKAIVSAERSMLLPRGEHGHLAAPFVSSARPDVVMVHHGGTEGTEVNPGFQGIGLGRSASRLLSVVEGMTTKDTKSTKG